ncbi:hypothetical protein MBM_02801 [Drepanopeziza brunnea f. sp. 'multigermtubi' MB_m1]|uniref:Uncharacterized protein n=1 Tax=Marssonina brunnea f. sp. multigermtubi (strain MB_m1) TaxID=1072389 RepID=K1Y348_MARBU|nr:uncharacterized protein MBM_02801 [Drepanopeziza brunnea f. sp. 'multigermtubi' MB_m1]EKD19564.1 hypothetical protein MBM_02801 [Drepanopeziza brunnea f. sp. 'multigermtubi' MB_m1]
MLRLISIFAIFLAFSSLFNKVQGVKRKSMEPLDHSRWNQQIVIGYAKVPEDQAERINEDNRLFVDETASRRLGTGFDIVEYPGFGVKEGNWYCAIEANSMHLERIGKVYIPFYHSTYPEPPQYLWNQGDEVILDYIQQKGLAEDPFTALRISYIEAEVLQMQMLIPAIVIEQDYLNLRAKCFDSVDDLKTYSSATMNWLDELDIKGR